jgi:OHCU decarboxylase
VPALVLSPEALDDCCGSRRWRELMAAEMPFTSAEAGLAAAARAFDALERSDWLEAFEAHSMIGAVRPGAWTDIREQSGMEAADAEQRTALAAGNVEYCARFGFVFLIRASGRGPAELLAALRERLANGPEQEFANACAAEREIVGLRLEALLLP